MTSTPFAEFRHIPMPETMLTFAGWRGGFNTIRTSMVQLYGANADAKWRDSRAVTDAEFDRAVMSVLTSAMCLLSGKLDGIEVER